MLKRHHETLWTWSVPLSIGPFELGARTTILRCGDGLLLHSPVAFNDEALAAIRGLGRVAWIVAPSAQHHKYAGQAKQAFPDATLLGAASLLRKRKDLAFDGTLDTASIPDTTWVHVEGAPKLDEWLLVHPPSRTLVVTDFLFHYPAHASWFTRLYLRLGGALGHVAQTPITRGYLKDKAAVRSTCARVLALDWDRIVVTHGEVLEAGGKQAFTDATEWLGKA